MNKTNKSEIKYLSIKLVIYTILSILVIVFRHEFTEHLKPFIGTLMIVYGIEGILYEALFHKLHLIHENKSYLGLIELIFGVVLIASPLKFEYVCIIWATWSIVRESYEFKEIVSDMHTIIPRILSGVESVVVIVFSVMLILEPGEHHALTHMILLSVELILSPLVVLLDELLVAHKHKE